jgi:hypothetical protein
MLDGLEGFLAGGGNLMYLGGNGLYWVTSVHPTRPVIEVRRVLGTGLTRAPDGELYHSTTGELGGIWRARGRAPQRLLGVGFCAQGALLVLPTFAKKPALTPGWLSSLKGLVQTSRLEISVCVLALPRDSKSIIWIAG